MERKFVHHTNFFSPPESGMTSQGCDLHRTLHLEFPKGIARASCFLACGFCCLFAISPPKEGEGLTEATC